jgi:hypothetical protein
MNFLLFVVLFTAGCGWLDMKIRSGKREEV